MDLFVRSGTTKAKKQKILHAFCRAELKKFIPELKGK